MRTVTCGAMVKGNGENVSSLEGSQLFHGESGCPSEKHVHAPHGRKHLPLPGPCARVTPKTSAEAGLLVRGPVDPLGRKAPPPRGPSVLSQGACKVAS